MRARGSRPVVAFVVLAFAQSLGAGALGHEPSPFLKALDASPLAWRSFPDATRADALSTGRPLFLLLGPSRLAGCGRPETSLIANDGVQAALERGYTAVAIDCTERPDACDVYTAAVALLQPDAERDGRALWIVATPEGWPFAAGAVGGEPNAPLNLATLLDEQAQRYSAQRGETRLRAGATAAELRQGQASPAPLRPLDRDVVTRSLKGVRDSAGPSGRLDAPLHGALRLLLAEAGGNADARRVLARTLDAIAAERLPACRDATAELALRVRALTLGYALTGNAPWRAAAESLVGTLLARRDALGGLRSTTDDERVFVSDNGLALGALALSGTKLGRPADIVAARATADGVLKRLGPAASLRRFASGDVPRGSAVLADYAFLAEGLLDLFDATSESRWRDEATALVDVALVRFADPAGGVFDSDDTALLARPRNAYDGDQPAASAVMASVLLRLASATGQTRYADLARAALTSFLGDLQRAPRGLETLAAVARDLVAQPVVTATPEPRFEPRAGAVSGTLTLSAQNLRAGGTIEARIALTIADGYSVNAHLPGSRDLYGLSVSVVGESLRAGPPVYPPAANVPRRFSKESVLGHVGQARVTLPLTVARVTPVGEMPVRVRVGFQACTERACQPPDSLVLEAMLQVTR